MYWKNKTKAAPIHNNGMDFKQNKDNNISVPDHLRDSFRRIRPFMVQHRDVLLADHVHTKHYEISAKENVNTTANSVNSPYTHERSENGDSHIFQDHIHEDILKDVITRLKVKGMKCYNLKWQNFKKQEWNDESTLIDLQISIPSTFPTRSFINATRSKSNVEKELDISEVCAFPILCKSVSKTGNYVVLPILYIRNCTKDSKGQGST